MKVLCRTLFDITATGVTGHFRPSRIPFADAAGSMIYNETDWNRARNQQRNWETLTQVLQLRTQIFDLSKPVTLNDSWQFEFSTEIESLFAVGSNEFAVLHSDCDGVPMLAGLEEKHFLTSSLVVTGAQQNIWFETINKILE
jgi:hypothetical protein